MRFQPCPPNSSLWLWVTPSGLQAHSTGHRSPDLAHVGSALPSQWAPTALPASSPFPAFSLAEPAGPLAANHRNSCSSFKQSGTRQRMLGGSQTFWEGPGIRLACCGAGRRAKPHGGTVLAENHAPRLAAQAGT